MPESGGKETALVYTLSSGGQIPTADSVFIDTSALVFMFFPDRASSDYEKKFIGLYQALLEKLVKSGKKIGITESIITEVANLIFHHFYDAAVKKGLDENKKEFRDSDAGRKVRRKVEKIVEDIVEFEGISIVEGITKPAEFKEAANMAKKNPLDFADACHLLAKRKHGLKALITHDRDYFSIKGETVFSALAKR